MASVTHNIPVDWAEIVLEGKWDIQNTGSSTVIYSIKGSIGSTDPGEFVLTPLKMAPITVPAGEKLFAKALEYPGKLSVVPA